MSKEDWLDHKEFHEKRGCKVLPSYDDILEEKKKCYPNNIDIGDFEGIVPLKDLLEKTCQRFFEDTDNYMMMLRNRITYA